MAMRPKPRRLRAVVRVLLNDVQNIIDALPPIRWAEVPRVRPDQRAVCVLRVRRMPNIDEIFVNNDHDVVGAVLPISRGIEVIMRIEIISASTQRFIRPQLLRVSAAISVTVTGSWQCGWRWRWHRPQSTLRESGPASRCSYKKQVRQ